MTTVIAQPYPSTAQFRSAAKFLAHNAKADEVVYNGYVKIHGTNASLIQYEPQGKIYCQSKTRTLDLVQDNSGFCRYMEQFDLQPLFEQVTIQHVLTFGKESSFPIEIAGEWAGKGIQKGVAVSEVEKFFAVFGVRVGNSEASNGVAIGWQPIEIYQNLKMHEARIFNITEFGKFTTTIKVLLPQASTNALGDITNQVEEECPVGKFFGVKGVGEGVVWTPNDPELCDNPGSWFKVKGVKHSVTKVKTLAPVDPVKLKSITDFVEYACTENRLEQGLQEVGLDIKTVGAFIGWVNKDIYKEEADTLEANGLTMKEVGCLLSQQARQFYLSKM